MQNKKRIAAYDAVKLFTIFLVLWGHCILHLQGYEYNCWDNVVYRFICSFHMPLFMMVAGFFGSHVDGVRFKEFFVKKFRTLVLPALTMGLIFCISFVYIVGKGQFIDTYIRCYWFLKSAFLCFMLYYAAMQFPKVAWGIILSIIASQFIFIYNVHTMYPCFLIGVLIHRHEKLFNEKTALISAISLLLFLFCFGFDDYEMVSTPVLHLHRLIHLSPKDALYRYGIHLYYIIIGISGSVFTISLFVGMGKYFPRTRIGDILLSWGALTLGIYLLQAILLEHFMMLTINLAEMNWYLFNLIVSPAISVGVLILCVGLIKIIRLSPTARLVLLGEKSSAR